MENRAAIEKIDHIGFAVKSIKEALKLYKEVYGLEPIKIEVHENIKVKIAFIAVGGVLIELLEPTQPGEGRIGAFLDAHGEGFHHIAYRVSSIEDSLQRLKCINVPLIDSIPRIGGDGAKIAFIDPTFTRNVLTEFVERKKEVSIGTADNDSDKTC